MSWGALVAQPAKDVWPGHPSAGLGFRRHVGSECDQEGRYRFYLVARVFYHPRSDDVTHFRLWPMFLLLWVVPILTWLKMIMRVRSIAEHFAVENDHACTQSRTTLPSFLERVFVAPRHVNFHLEHHLYPSVPFFRLPQLHAVLMKDPVFQSRAHITSTYRGVLRECVGSSR